MVHSKYHYCIITLFFVFPFIIECTINTLIIYSSGYMAPEYAFHGLFSMKSDVFSFGILILEIVSGKKNGGSSFASQCQNLIGHVSKVNCNLTLFS